jgi:flagellar biosynthetic protein FlhB
MAENVDRETKTEEATPKRVEDALAKGNTPFSRELGPVAVILCVGLSAPLAVGHLADRLSQGLRLLIDRPHELPLATAEDAASLIWLVMSIAALGLLPLLVGLMFVGVVGAGIQNQPRFVLHRIKPEASRIALSSGWSRILGRQGLIEFLKSMVKLAVVCLAMYFVIKGRPERVLEAINVPAQELPELLTSEVGRLFLLCGLCLVAVAIADLVWSRLKWRLDLRMSPQELKDEHKQMEGDPMVRARQRSLARDRARQRMLSSVPRATLVVVNPTHYAVAMRFVQGESPAPVVMAKGIDHLALRIRDIAERSGVPVIEDRLLARSLYEAVKTDRPIPPEFYRAVAEIILFLMSGKTRPLEQVPAPPKPRT